MGLDPHTSAVLLDIDGTLVDSTYHHALAWQRAFAAVTQDPPAFWRLHRSIGMGGDKLVTHVAGQAAEDRHGDALRDRWKQEYADLLPQVRPLPGATDLVRGLSAQGFRVALASSGDPDFARDAIRLLGVDDDIELLTTAEDVDRSKPDPDLLRETLQRLGNVEHAVLVGDTVYDVESAARSDLRCIALLSGGNGYAELLDAGAVRVAREPADLIDLYWPVYLSPV